MDARDLFEIIGRLYAANVELNQEGERLKVQTKMAAEEKKAMAKEIDELTMKCKELEKANEAYMEAIDELKLQACVVCKEAIVDARREEETLNQDSFFD